jgi:hypothetical protein
LRPDSFPLQSNRDFRKESMEKQTAMTKTFTGLTVFLILALSIPAPRSLPAQNETISARFRSSGAGGCSPAHDATTDQQATGTAINSPSLTATSGALEFGFAATDSSVATVNTPWTQGTSYVTSGNSDDYILSASGSSTAQNMTGNASTAWGSVVSSIKLTGCGAASVQNKSHGADSATGTATVAATITVSGSQTATIVATGSPTDTQIGYVDFTP